MSLGRTFGWLGSVSRALVTQTRDDPHLRRSLVESLYASPTSLAAGAACGTMVAVTIAVLARTPAAAWLATLICVIAIVRTIAAFSFHHFRRRADAASTKHWERLYEMGAWLYAGMLGLMAFCVLQLESDIAIHLLAVSLTAGYSGGISGRNAGRVEIAIGQTILALGPTVIGLWMHGGLAWTMLGITLAVMILGMIDISRTIHRTLMAALVEQQEKSRLALKYERIARYDRLTGLDNRMAMQARLNLFLDERRTDQDRPLAILWLDLDRFKTINDLLGHIVGDELLCAVASRLVSTVGDAGHVARFGGDEFVILCPDASEEMADHLAADIVAAFHAPFELTHHQLSVSSSVGIAIAPFDGHEEVELLQHADLALFEAKKHGRDNAQRFRWSMKDLLERNRQLENGLRQAIDDNLLTVVYQPIYDIKTGRVSTCEALVRWTHPSLGPISPGEFIPIAESSGLIGALTRRVLQTACATAATWPADVRIAVNISAQSFRGGELSDAVMGALLNSGLSPSRLEIEVTESLFLERDTQVDMLLSQLRSAGVRMSLDDFGTGYSSLSYLRSFRFDSVKIDQSFVRSAGEDREDRAVIAAIAFLAQQLDMETIAEGIETPRQLAYVSEMGLTHCQGFLMCRPVSAEVVIEAIHKGFHVDTGAPLLRKWGNA